jgi:hypothetical protein
MVGAKEVKRGSGHNILKNENREKESNWLYHMCREKGKYDDQQIRRP